MSKVFSYLGKYKFECILSPLLKVIEAFLELLVPLIVAEIIDDGIANSNSSFVINRAVILIVIALFGGAISILGQYFAARAASYFSRDLRKGIFDKIQSLSFTELDNVGASSLITRITSDTNIIQNGVNLVLRLFLRSPFIVIGTVIMAFTIDLKCAIIFLITILILSFIIFLVMRSTLPRYRIIQNKLDGLTLSARENLDGARVVRAFTNEDKETDEFKGKNNLLVKFQNAVGRISALLNPLTYVIINFAVIAIIEIGSSEVDNGTLTQGEIVALYNYMIQVLAELLKLANLIVTISRAYASCLRIADILNLQDESDDKPIIQVKKETENTIDFENVSLKYKTSTENSISNISFSAKSGSVTGIVGSTASGKTSLVSLIPRFYDATSGVVRINGIDVKSFDKDTIRSKIGFVMQNNVLFEGTIRDNIKWGNPDANDDEIFEALKDAQIYDTVMEKGGLDAPVYQNGSNFSGGQKQRLSIARALVRKPDILILDDCTSALDYATESKLINSIYSLPYNPTVFIISQRVSSVVNSDKILVLDDGCIVGTGTHSELLSGCEVYREIYSSQFGEEVSQ